MTSMCVFRPCTASIATANASLWNWFAPSPTARINVPSTSNVTSVREGGAGSEGEGRVGSPAIAAERDAARRVKARGRREGGGDAPPATSE